MSDSQDIFDDSVWSKKSKATLSKSKRNRTLTTSWTKIQASKLVFLIKEEERLWNKFHPDYKHYKESRIVWHKIAKQLERKTEDCLNKWSALRSNFKSRYVDKTKSGGEAPTAEDMPEPYCHMGFLMDMMQRSRRSQYAAEAMDSSSILEPNDEVVAEESCEILETAPEIVDPLFSSSLPSPPTQPAPKRRTLGMANRPVISAVQKETMLGAAFERMMKPEDEWDKMAQVLAEHMRNAVNEFPHLADRFRVQLLEVSLDVQNERVNARSEAAMVLNIDFKTE